MDSIGSCSRQATSSGQASRALRSSWFQREHPGCVVVTVCCISRIPEGTPSVDSLVIARPCVCQMRGDEGAKTRGQTALFAASRHTTRALRAAYHPTGNL